MPGRVWSTSEAKEAWLLLLEPRRRTRSCRCAPLLHTESVQEFNELRERVELLPVAPSASSASSAANADEGTAALMATN